MVSVSGQEFVHHDVAASPSIAFAAGSADCEVVALAWPDSAQLTVGTWRELCCREDVVAAEAAAAVAP
jgi:hypothetical protein